MRKVDPSVEHLIQRRADAELPASGRWELHRSSFVGVSAGRDHRQLLVADGALTITDPPQRSMLQLMAAQRNHWLRLAASAVELYADQHGFSRWELSGT